ncbi:hypothetical protein DES53_103178 [Roseimicrobium gellanilyticum]|uniref:Periplasmic nitrate reductase chaperone NapD n=1 Tax=Roseimicrobium gellanilyticum TaxID=748857 RepID=A0A366HP89_9BACT|nr:hypothetical protein [Roseimicrobium gellanilyticum]RBP45181.1 hypothetical protein DES53_103178 [Roseimicrobium gellanilyticum]
MPISGLVITLAEDCRLAQEAVTALAARPEIMMGARQQRWLPVAVDGRDQTHSREVHDWIGLQPGVTFVDVTSVSFEIDSPLSAEVGHT